jgi:hypothetical protein
MYTGTVRLNRAGLPDVIKKVLKRKGDMVAARKGQLVAVSWVDRKQMRLLSTHATADTTEIKIRCGSQRAVPNVVVEYNKGMGGVHLSDQMTDQYACERRNPEARKLQRHF